MLNLYVLSGLSWVLGHRGPPHQFKVQFPAWNHSLEASAQNPALPSALGLTRLVSVCPEGATRPVSEASAKVAQPSDTWGGRQMKPRVCLGALSRG